MIMTMSNGKTIPAARFKAECLALLDRVHDRGEALIVTKRGKPVARVVPIVTEEPRSLLGSVHVVGDLLAPLDEEWHAAR